MPFVKNDPRINREGRPVGSVSIVAELKKKLEEIPEGEKKTYLEKIVKVYLDKALNDKDTKILTDIIDRIDGKALQKINANVTNVEEELDKIDEEVNDEIHKQAEKQVVETNPSLQNQIKDGGTDNLPSDDNSSTTPSSS